MLLLHEGDSDFSQVSRDSRTLDSQAHHVIIDARSIKPWVHYSLAEGKIVHPQYVSSLDWDLAFRRYHIIANGGAINLAAKGGIRDLGPVKWGAVHAVPSSGYLFDTRTPSGTEVENLAIRHWYNYDYTTHILTPMNHVYVIQSPKQDHYYLMRILNYYCPKGESGCLSFEYKQFIGDTPRIKKAL